MNITITFGRRGSDKTATVHLTGTHYPRNAARVCACDALAMAQDHLGGALGDLRIIRALDQATGLRWVELDGHKLSPVGMMIRPAPRRN
jgi:hypothetical protein